MPLSPKLLEQIQAGEKLNTSFQHSHWVTTVHTLLETAVDFDTARKFSDLGEGFMNNWKDAKEKQIRYLETVASKHGGRGNIHSSSANNVFIVYGNDTETKDITVRFIEQLGLNPIALHSEEDSARSVIESFKPYHSTGFIIVLLTADDVGASVEDKKHLHHRAQQNVILELGYFTGKRGLKNVCALYQEGVEIPSDFQDVLYIILDQQGAWKAKLIQELVNDGLTINSDD